MIVFAWRIVAVRATHTGLGTAKKYLPEEARYFSYFYP